MCQVLIIQEFRLMRHFAVIMTSSKISKICNCNRRLKKLWRMVLTNWFNLSRLNLSLVNTFHPRLTLVYKLSMITESLNLDPSIIRRWSMLKSIDAIEYLTMIQPRDSFKTAHLLWIKLTGVHKLLTLRHFLLAIKSKASLTPTKQWWWTLQKLLGMTAK